MTGIDWKPELKIVPLQNRSIELWVPDPAIAKSLYESGEIAFPYWSKLWSSAIALAGFIAGKPEHTAGKTVLELGAGLGLPSLVAAANSLRVIASDKEPAALEIIRRSAAHHQYNNLNTKLINWMEATVLPPADLVLMSDVNYEAAALQSLQHLLDHFRKNHVSVILATPQRIVAREFVSDLANTSREHHTMAVKNESGETQIELLLL